MCDAARFIKIEAAAAAKSTAPGRAAKRPYKSPNAACPTGWVRHRHTDWRFVCRLNNTAAGTAVEMIGCIALLYTQH